MVLKDKALIVSLTIRNWSGRKYDQTVTNEVDEKHDAEDAGRFNKLLVELSEMRPITQVSGKLRTFLYKNTMAWGDNGDRILPAKRYFEFTKGLDKLVQKYNSVVQAFIQDYDMIKARRKSQLKDLYRETDYPSQHDLETRFRVKLHILPLTDESDFRLALNAEEVEVLRQRISVEITDRHTAAVGELMGRAKSVVDRIIKTLTKETDKLIFRDSMIGDVEDLVEIMPSLNYMNDPKIDELTKAMDNLIVDPDHIRSDEDIKAQILERSKKLSEMFF